MVERVVHVKKDAFDAYVGRRMSGVDVRFARFGNPFRLASEAQRGSTLTDYLGYLLTNPDVVRDARVALAETRVLACWCAPRGGVGVDDALVCHAQVLARAMRGDYDARS
jgi:hypothetical protein